MATWKLCNLEPIYCESARRVFRPDTGEEGYADVRRDPGTRADGTTGQSRGLTGPVYIQDRLYDNEGNQIGSENFRVLDASPVFE